MTAHDRRSLRSLALVSAALAIAPEVFLTGRASASTELPKVDHSRRQSKDTAALAKAERKRQARQQKRLKNAKL